MEQKIVLGLAKEAGKSALHGLQRTLSVLAFVGLGWAIYVMAIKPHVNPTPTEEYAQQAEKIVNVEHHYSKPEEAFFLGIKFWGFKFGITKDKKVDVVEDRTAVAD